MTERKQWTAAELIVACELVHDYGGWRRPGTDACELLARQLGRSVGSVTWKISNLLSAAGAGQATHPHGRGRGRGVPRRPGGDGWCGAHAEALSARPHRAMTVAVLIYAA
ncbi:hypothetical protein [Mycobacterium sp. GA-1285]|uniref:hypothetical protein n=1 Tax=Mycobacterium sp. GA-1285 TaxID=1772282 RepID=UPI0012E3852C|nr:hypothetical protein [Mycobacterium sp. GA-1285]